MRTLDAPTTQCLLRSYGFVYMYLSLSFLLLALLVCVGVSGEITGAGNPGLSPCVTAATWSTTRPRGTTSGRLSYLVPNNVTQNYYTTQYHMPHREDLSMATPVRLETGLDAKARVDLRETPSLLARGVVRGGVVYDRNRPS